MNHPELGNQLYDLSDNLCLYYARLVDDIHQQLMAKATAAGHEGLRLSHALILPQISADGSRIIDIAKSQGVSKQAIGQLANELESLGYITRIIDPGDKRSRKLTLTSKGIDLIRESASFMNEVDEAVESRMGAGNFPVFKELSRKLFKSMALKYPDAGQYVPEIQGELPIISHATAIAQELDIRLQEENTRKGHPALKRSYWQVLEKIGLDGVRINELAEQNGITKQAVSQLAGEIEKAGYITRANDPDDKRAKKILMSESGQQLIQDTLDSTQKVESELIDKLGTESIKTLKHCLKQYLSSDKPLAQLSQLNTSSNFLKSIRTLLQNLPSIEQSRLLTEFEDGQGFNEDTLEKLASLRF